MKRAFYLLALLCIIMGSVNAPAYCPCYSEPPLNENYVPKEVGKFNWVLSNYIGAADLDGDGKEEIVFVHIEESCGRILYIVNESGVEFSLDIVSLAGGYPSTYITVFNRSVYILYISELSNILIPRIVEVYYTKAGYRYRIRSASPLPNHMLPIGFVCNVWGAIALPNGFLAATIPARTPGQLRASYYLLLVNLNTYNSYLFPWGGLPDIVNRLCYAEVGGAYVIPTLDSVVVINGSNVRSIDIPHAIDVGVFIPLVINDTAISIVSSLPHVFTSIIVDIKRNLSQIVRNDILAYDVNYTVFTAYRDEAYIMFGGGPTVFLTYNATMNSLTITQLPWRVESVILVEINKTPYLYMFGVKDGYYIYNPENGFFNYIPVMMPGAGNGRLKVASYAILADVNGDTLYELVLYRQVFDETPKLATIYVLPIKAPRGLTPLPESPVQIHLLVLATLTYIILRNKDAGKPKSH